MNILDENIIRKLPSVLTQQINQGIDDLQGMGHTVGIGTGGLRAHYFFGQFMEISLIGLSLAKGTGSLWSKKFCLTDCLRFGILKD